LRDIRIAIGEKMTLGLDFFLAGDIIQTIVVIRTVMAFFLAKEIEKSATAD